MTKQKIISTSLITLLLVSAVGLTVFYITKNYMLKEVNLVVQDDTTLGVPAPGFEDVEEMIVNETANWQTYRNEEFGYTFTFPENWSFLDLSDGFSITSPDYNAIGERPFGPTTINGAIVTVTHRTTSLSNISEYEFAGPSKDLLDAYGLTETKVSGFDAIEREWEYAGDASLHISFIANGLWFDIYFNGETANERDSKYFNIFQQMIDNMKVEG